MMRMIPMKHLNVQVQFLFATLTEIEGLMGKGPSLKKRSIMIVIKLFTYNILVMKPENIQFIHPPIMIIGSTFVRLPFNISVIMVGSVIMF